ncbi:MAG: hypothetical protein ABI594_10430 [Ginsengibacter sp.]
MFGWTVKTDGLHIWLNGNVDAQINIIGNVSVDLFNNYDWSASHY